ncbi:ATP-binding SpoIIE family protein phosphatase [Streptomyces flaveolus]|uniref:ATP-binding SpoIIE family protein phosphatase n=1 Tax=Streptomyces flaveolus TaxID=67297 RepID=UPI0033309674
MSRVWDIPVHDSTRVRDARVAAETAGVLARLSPHRTAITALVATELATNLLKHAGGGRMVINLVERADTTGAGVREVAVQLCALDHGSGIPDVTTALRDGYTTEPGSLGAGLGTCLRISSAFDLHSTAGRGTVALARIDQHPATGQRPPAGPDVTVGAINVSLARAEHSGDAMAWVRHGSRLTLLHADGLGHGAKAAHASTTAVDELHRTAHLPPAEILRHLHTVLRPTRGVAAAVAQLDAGTRRLSFAGVGNIGARLRTAGGWQALISHPGIVGAAFPATVPVRQMPWHGNSLLILHSDGLPSRWMPPEDPRLLDSDPAVVAAAILRDAGSPALPVRDDTSVAVMAPNHRTSTHGPSSP